MSCFVWGGYRTDIKSESVAVYAKDKNFRNQGSSGNAFGLLVELFKKTKENSVIYGAAYNSDFYGVSCRSTDEVTLQQLQKSKYLESFMSDSILRIKSDLDRGRNVLFCGTPCQVMGLRSVFGYRDDLLLCDIICHGVTSSKWYEKYIKTIESKYDSKVISVDFRSKLVGWAPYCLYVLFDNNKEYIRTSIGDPYLVDFGRNNHLRTNCYNCNRIIHSQSDITIGDYWAVRAYKNIENTNEGISIVRAQTILGKYYLDILRKESYVYIKELSETETRKTFVYRKRPIPKNSDSYPKDFPMRPKRTIKGWARYFYYEFYVKRVKYHVKERK